MSQLQKDASGEHPLVSSEFVNSRSMKLGKHFYDFPTLWPEMASFVLLAVANALNGWPQWTVVAVGAVVGIIALFGHSRSAKRISEVETQRDHAIRQQGELETSNEQLTSQVKALQSSMVALLDRSLFAFAQEFHFGNTERISVYLHRRQSQVFEGKARYCKDVNLDRFRRDIYKDDEGCIGKAMRNGSWVVRGLPDPSDNVDEWKAEQYRQTGLDTSIASTIRLQARDIGAYAVENGHRIGVVVVESSRTDVLDFELIETVVTRESAHLAEVLQMILDHTEDSRAAAQEGF